MESKNAKSFLLVMVMISCVLSSSVNSQECKKENDSCVPVLISQCCAGLHCNIVDGDLNLFKCGSATCSLEGDPCVGAPCCDGLGCSLISGTDLMECKKLCQKVNERCGLRNTPDCCSGLTCQEISRRITCRPCLKFGEPNCAAGECCDGLKCGCPDGSTNCQELSCVNA